MIREKFIIGMRNRLAELAVDCDSCAAIERGKMTRQEREELQALIRKAYRYIDKKLGL